MSITRIEPRTRAHLFDPKYPPSVANLSDAMTINSVTKYPTFRYKGGDADGTNLDPWGYGEILPLQAGTAPTYNDGSPLHGPAAIDDSVHLNHGGYYANASTFTGNVGTNDFVIELVFKFDNSTINNTIFSTRDPIAPFYGIDFFNALSGKLRMYLVSAVGTTTAMEATDLVDGSIYHLIGFVDRSGRGLCYVNGVNTPSWSVSAQVAVSLSYNVLSLGSSHAIPARCWNQNIYYAAMWQGAGWLDTHLQPAVAADRFERLCGIRPKQIRSDYTPETASRADIGFSSKLESDGTTKLYSMGQGWIRSSSWADTNGIYIQGPLIEQEDTNELKRSLELTTAPWTDNGGVTVNTAETLAPDGTQTATLVASSWVYQIPTPTIAEDDPYSISFWFKRKDTADLNIVQIHNSSDAPNHGRWYINPSGMPDEWVLISRNSPYVTVDVEFSAHAANTVNLAITISGIIGGYFWNPQIIVGKGQYYYSSCITTEASAVTRSGDDLSYDATALMKAAPLGGISFDMCYPQDIVAPPAAFFGLRKLASAGTDIIQFLLGDGTDAPWMQLKSNDVWVYNASGNTIDLRDGQIYEIYISWYEDAFYVEATLKATGVTTVIFNTTASADISDGDDFLLLIVGSHTGSTYQIGPGILNNFKLLDKPRRD